ncbi:F-box domain protein [Kalmanozyma brasiliensis GHG001]|uniref:F-box domain-containing protein n=1 Tax=Kalmanozyma brasiliensis (strain GHG001) TaxID=1365824 RepID=V5EVF0_KALBG|nr:F-box domain protein [Kalmanozyma brasiliensis GHG001]EST07213.1 F-box domain protein [Kalmanozyma brasiliensis GHG001]
MPLNPLDLPLPLVVDNLLPLLPNRDLATLRSVSRHAKTLVEDEVLWRRKVLSDFTFPPHASARMGGWFNLYCGLSSPRVYVWGQLDNGRLGLAQLPAPVREDARGSGGGVPYPVELESVGASRMLHGGQGSDGEDRVGAVVEIVAGGWGFHARTSTGRVWFWGTMDGETFAGPVTPMRDPGKIVPHPQLLDALPPIAALSGGRCHAVALTTENKILEWRSWGTVWEHQGLDVAGEVTQLEAGWSFTALLTHDGAVWVWYSDWSADAFTRTYYAGNPRAAMMHAEPVGHEGRTVFTVDVTPVQLPPLTPPTDADVQDRIIQIAAGEDFLIALTATGQLYRMDLHLPPPTSEDHLLRRRILEARDDPDDRDLDARVHAALMGRYLRTRATWERLSAFEDPTSSPAFDPAWLYAPGADGKSTVGKVSHISAHFRRFVAFLPTHTPGADGEAGTLVLLGTPSGKEPELIPELQCRGVIKVTMGDYHYGALTERGEILTWGAFSKGALGNWAPPWAPVANESRPYDPGNVEEQGDEGERGWLDNLIPLPRIFRGPMQPRIGFAGRGRVQRSSAGRGQVREGQSQADVATPTVVNVHPQGQGKGTPFAFDIAFAGWHSSALVMDAPVASAEGE